MKYIVGPAGTPVAVADDADIAPEGVSAGQAGTQLTKEQAAADYQNQLDAEWADNTPGASAASFAGGVLDTATFGLGNALANMGASALSDGDYDANMARFARQDEALKKHRSLSNVLGQGVGLGLGMLSGSTESKFAKLLPWGAAEGVGSAAERLAMRALPAADTALGKIGIAGAKMATRGAAEGALISALQNISEQAIANKPFSAEALASAAGDGALFGGAFGAGLGGLGTAGGEVASKFKIGRAEGGLGKAIQEKAEEYLSKRMGAGAGDLEALNQKAGGKFLTKAEKLLNEEGLSITSDPRAIREAAERVARKSGDAILPAARELDAAAKEFAPSYSRFAAEVNEKILPEFAGTRPDVVRAVNKFVRKLEDGADGTFGSWAKRASQMGDQIVGEGASADARRRVAGLFRGEFQRAATEAGQSGNPAVREALGRYQAANASYGIAKDLVDLAGKAKSAPGLAQRAVDNATNMGWTGAIAPGFAAKAIAIRTVGGAVADATLPTIAKMISGLERTQEIATRTSVLKASIRDAAKGFVSAPTMTRAGNSVFANIVAKASSRDGYQKMYSRAVEGISRTRQEQIRNLKGGDMSQSIQDLHSRASAYLMAHLPPDRDIRAQLTLRGTPAHGELSMEEHEFVRRMAAVMHPLEVIQDIKNGNVTRVAVEALQAVYPEMYAELKDSTIAAVMEAKANGKPMSIMKLGSMSIMLGTAMDPMFEPKYVNAVQNTFLPEAPGPGRPRNANAANVADSYQTVGEKNQ